ncbi:heavy metal-binding domain-containing protein [Flavobacterium sp.]|uniref:heavy metal-binding domain-containing protein n=1 Tax=Flavobacterium sp. TaxID=239 RepID=UPI00286E0910|nr:heavy metal-binding domain-containing protein [Flavobacterium sp.]
MKKIFFSAIVMALLTVSCNQKTKESTTDDSNMMSNDTTMMDNNGTMMSNDTTMMSNDTTMMNDKTKMMNDQTKIYACPMHPEVQGKLNDKCSKCGMKLTVPVAEK